MNIPSFIVRLDSRKHIKFALISPFGGGRAGRDKRKNLKKGCSLEGKRQMVMTLLKRMTS
jgi:hypothetical protein